MKRNSRSINDKVNKDLYGEEIDYYIETISNSKDSINNSDKNSDNNIAYIPRNRHKNKNSKNDQMIYKKINTKDQYIKSLEKKIRQQDMQISKLTEYKDLCESTIKKMNPLISLPLNNIDINDNDSELNNNENNDYISNLNKKRGKSKNINLSFNDNYSHPKNATRDKIIKNRANSEFDINIITNNDNDKYDKLYSKYIKIINDYKNLSNNSVSTNEYTRLKTQYNELKNKNNNLLKQIQNERNKSNDDIRENEIIKNLKEQVKTFREELVLSQAMVNSLRAEIEQYTKNNQNKINNQNDEKNYNDIDDLDNFYYNNNNVNNNRRINKKLKEENDNLKFSLKNNSLLLKKVLEENNRLREQNNDNQQNQNMNLVNLNQDESIKNIKDKLNKYEEKFDYFNDYINNIKNQISILLNDLKSIIYNLDNPEMTKKFSNNYINKLLKLKNEILKLKNIDRFNLDSNDDEECLKQYKNLVQLLLNGLEEIKLNNNNNNFNNNFNDNNNNTNNKYINRNDSNYNNVIDNTRKYLKEILEILKNNSNENGVKQLLEDALNIVDELSNLYKIRNKNEFNNINEQIMEKEKELEYIKKLLLNQNKIVKNKQLTYSMNYYSPRIESRNKNGYYFVYG